ncbi:MAG: dipeptidase [Ignavibacteria bacterium]|nr:dipeptidase [Ignavibacteria bacterium]
MEELLNFIECNQEKHLEQLKEFLKLKSISSEPEYKEEVRRTAMWLKIHLSKIGFEKTQIFETKGHPIVYAEWLGAGPNAKTVLIYGHYDVQPVDPIEEWNTPPFEPTVIDGKLYARGTADDKGQIFAHIKGIEAHFQTYGKLPVNVKLLIEGEEEAGSGNLDEFIENNKELLKCDTVLISDTEWYTFGLPSICYALRGISFVEVKVIGPNRDLHSGSYGGAVDNPIFVLAKMLTMLKDERGKIIIPGFYDDVIKVSEEERKHFKNLPFSEDELKKSIEVEELSGEIDFSVLERIWIRPSIDVNGIKGGYIGEGMKTIIPSEASAKISMRLVPNQNPQDITEKLSKYLISIAPKSVKVIVNPAHGGNPVITPIDSPGIKAAVKALEVAFNKKPVFMREGGSIPVTDTFSKMLGAPPVLMGLGLPDDNIHAPNEKINLENFFGGIKASAVFLCEYSKL